MGRAKPQTLLETSTANGNLSGQSPSILLRKTVRSLKVPTGDFIAALRFANANLSFLYFLAAKVLHFYFKNLHSLSCVGNFLIN